MAPPGVRDTEPFADRKRDRLERLETGKQRVDLEGAGEASLDALLRRKRGDVVVAKQHLPSIRLQSTGDQVYQRGLAGAVRADQCMARALRQRYRDILRHDERAEAFVQVCGAKCRGGHAAASKGYGTTDERR